MAFSRRQNVVGSRGDCSALSYTTNVTPCIELLRVPTGKLYLSFGRLKLYLPITYLLAQNIFFFLIQKKMASSVERIQVSPRILLDHLLPPSSVSCSPQMTQNHLQDSVWVPCQQVPTPNSSTTHDALDVSPFSLTIVHESDFV